ncbi:MAG: toprim domain-containing protein, partial [Gemmataceae bacterium]|nr:toprim domain-containing protein [Gemmataceae bacterium]
LEAQELLARRAGITLEKIEKNEHRLSRALMLDVMRWSETQFQECLLDAPHAELARKYLGERQLAGETVRRFGLGFAPPGGEWLVAKARAAGVSLEALQTLGLIGKRDEDRGYFDRFRDRVMFPIRDLQGRTVGFGGRILPTSPLLHRDNPPPKYYNSAESPLFSKSDQLFGIDLARAAAAKAGYLAVVEGYTDVMMAHQHGIANVVATMGTALNARHIRKIRQLVPRVVLVFDADAGGDAGVDRALELFVSQDLDVRVASLPAGLDPCDLLTAQGAAPFRQALDEAIDVLEYKLRRLFAGGRSLTIEDQRRAAENMLTILAAAPQRSVKLELMVNRIAHRLNLREETLWQRLSEVRARRAVTDHPAAAARTAPLLGTRPDAARAEAPLPRRAPAAAHERELIELLLADAALVAPASTQIRPEEVEHPGLRTLLEGLYALAAAGLPADLDHLHGRLDNGRLLDYALEAQDRGSRIEDRPAAFAKVAARFQEKRLARQRQELKYQVLAANDHDQAIELLARLKQNHA